MERGFVNCHFFALLQTQKSKHHRLMLVREKLPETGFIDWVDKIQKEIEQDTGCVCIVVDCKII